MLATIDSEYAPYQSNLYFFFTLPRFSICRCKTNKLFTRFTIVGKNITILTRKRFLCEQIILTKLETIDHNY